jgi:hypothetical protein
MQSWQPKWYKQKNTSPLSGKTSLFENIKVFNPGSRLLLSRNMYSVNAIPFWADGCP